MNLISTSRLPRTLLLIVIVALPSLASVQTGRRDHLTPQEADLVRDEQELDKRTELFIKAADRRFAVLNGTPITMPKKKTKEGEPEDWGEPPKGTRTELLSDIGGILDEAIDNIDNVSTRDPKNPLLGTSLRKLAAAARKYGTQLGSMREQAKDADEYAAIDRALESLQQILDAEPKAASIPDPTEKKKKKP